jgi:mono/diheme cytochrome c family protein
MEEERMSICRTFCCALVVTALALCAGAQDQHKVIKHEPAKPTSAASGREMFMSYCAACHGKDAKGDGPAASALKIPPADLTMLAKNNGGKYPAMRVTSVLGGQANLAAHGNKEMPVWGNVFWKMSGGHEAEVHQRIANLNHYIESLQVK